MTITDSNGITTLGVHQSHSHGSLHYGFISVDNECKFPFIGNQYFPHLKDQYESNDTVFFEDYFKSYDRYKEFIEKRADRSYVDMYASYQPFNESFKSLYPFLKQGLERIKPGRPILNLWDRNGWTTALLLNLFPENPIYTTWEGNKDVLGYQGYAYWFGDNENLKVIFSDLDQDWFFEDDFFDLVIGYDVLHRREFQSFLSKLNRITDKKGSIIFPHVHLSNSEPSPFFERGGIQIHGREYQNSFDQEATETGRSGFVLSEPMLFTFNDLSSSNETQKSMTTNPETNDYNALIALLSKEWSSLRLSPLRSKDFINGFDLKDLRILLNPLFHIDLTKGVAWLKSDQNEVLHLLERHPVYENRLNKSIQLSATQVIIIHLAQSGYSLEEINLISKQKFNFDKELLELEDSGLLQCIPLSKDHFAMQEFIGKQKVLHPAQTLDNLWYDSVEVYGASHNCIKLYDGSEFTYAEVDELVLATSHQLKSICAKGDRIAIISEPHLESIVLFWAAMLNGLVVIPVSNKLSTESLSQIFDETKPKMTFLSHYNLDSISALNTNYVIFDSDIHEEKNELYFSDWIESALETDDSHSKVQVDQSDLAIILYTSGSTGQPKGVRLNHQALYGSGLNMSSHFRWQQDDLYFCSGGMESMSGIRNMTVAPTLAGCSVYIPNPDSDRGILQLASELSRSGSTITATNPHFLTGLTTLGNHVSLNKLRLVLCTGNLLTSDLRKRFLKAYNLPIYNYYGHTETAGICIAQSINHDQDNQDSLGVPVNAVIQCVDENGQITGDQEVGELRIFSNSMSEGYFKGTKDLHINGWYYTGDLGRTTSSGEFEFIGRKREIFKTPNEQIIYLSIIQHHLIELNWIQNVLVRSHHVDGIERLILFVITNGKTPDSGDKMIKEAIRDQVTSESISITIIYNPGLKFINGKVSQEALLNEIENIQAV